MKYLLTLWLALPLLTAAQQAAPEIPLGEEQALQTTEFRGGTGDRQAKLRVWRDESYLHIAMWSQHPSLENKVANCTGHDEAVYSDDCLDVFIDAAGRQNAYYQVIANVNGAVFDHHKDDLGRKHSNWDSGASASGSYAQDSFEITLAIPLAALNLGENPAGEIGLAAASYVRHSREGRCAWGEYHQPKTWQRFTIPGEYPVLLESFRNSGGSGTQPFTASIRNVSPRPVELTGFFNGQPIRKIKLQPGGSADNKFLASHPAGEPAANVLSLHSAGREVLRLTRKFTPVQLLQAQLASPLRYVNDSLRLYGRINESPDAPLEVIVHSESGQTARQYTVDRPQFAFILPPQPVRRIECRYKNEVVNLELETISSPWEE
ncbi:MAG: hypothetical protein GX564_05795 [Oligosphaeraceae bacterium]|nr:hypothetical protein [Oligosphaeraceae bacterium]